MAKFAELTDILEGARLLINPDHVVMFEGDDEKGGTAIAVSVGRPFTVTEPPEEVLARLCAPVMPEGDHQPTHTLRDALLAALLSLFVDCDDDAETVAHEAGCTADQVRDMIRELSVCSPKSEG